MNSSVAVPHQPDTPGRRFRRRARRHPGLWIGGLLTLLLLGAALYGRRPPTAYQRPFRKKTPAQAVKPVATSAASSPKRSHQRKLERFRRSISDITKSPSGAASPPSGRSQT